MTTTESQITSGKAESIQYDKEFANVLNAYNDARRDRNRTDVAKEFDALIAHIEAVREKDREEARKEEEEATDDWRRLALQFDCHRMQALGHLKAMLQDPTVHRANAEQFLAARPLSGEVVLAERIAALAARQAPDLSKLEEVRIWLVKSRPPLTLSTGERINEYLSALATVEALLAPAQQEPAKDVWANGINPAHVTAYDTALKEC
jgi:hypothetical protein